MQEISLNILDIAQNSLRAQASLIKIEVTEDTSGDLFAFTVEDNGCGMDSEMLKTVSDPFVTTRSTRKVGLGISLLKSMAVQTGGDVTIESTQNVGTKLRAEFSHSSIDRQPLGDIASVMASLISLNPNVDFIYTHRYNGSEFVLDTRELRAILGEDVPLSENSVAMWIIEYINENLNEIYGGAR